MNHTTSAIVEIVNRLELWFEQQGAISTEYLDVSIIFNSTSGLWGCVYNPKQISQALQKIGSPKLHTNDDGSKIRRGTFEEVIKYQIEYYFGDKNYFKDSFLQAFKTDGNPEGYVPTVELLRFSKMKRIVSALPNVDLVKLIANVLTDSDVVAIHSDRAHIRRLSVEEGIIKKVEHFFRSSPLPREYIPISALATLPKLQRYDSEFVERVVQNASSNVFELSNDKYSLRRKTSYNGSLMIFHDRTVSLDYMIEPLPLQVTKYVEYLFGDVNFPKDNYMQSLSKQNEDGFIPLHEIMQFPRMRKMCTDHASVVEWLAHSDVVELSEDKTFLKRKNPLPEFRKMVFVQSLASKIGPGSSRVGSGSGSNTSTSMGAGLEGLDDSNSFTVMTYNILADFLTTTFQFPYTTPETRNWENRKKEILKEIMYYQPDVICLQEVQTVHNPDSTDITNNTPNSKSNNTVHHTPNNTGNNDKNDKSNGKSDKNDKNNDSNDKNNNNNENDHLWFFVSNLIGYEYIYKRKTKYKGPQTIGPDIGNAIFYNKAKFSLVSRHDVEFERILWKECKKDVSTRVMLGHGHPQVAVFGYLNHIPSGKNIFVATTHICSDYQIPYIQLRQVRACLNELQRYNKQKAPIVLAGDFNTQPESAVYHFLATGHVPKCHHATLHGVLKGLPQNLEFHHEVGLASAYAKVLGREPRCTNVTHEFEGTLDYLWYSKKSLRPMAVLDIPPHSCLKEEIGLPSKKFPSDHLPLLCKFKFHNS